MYQMRSQRFNRIKDLNDKPWVRTKYLDTRTKKQMELKIAEFDPTTEDKDIAELY